MVAGCGPVWPDIGGCWLLVRLHGSRCRTPAVPHPSGPRFTGC